MAEPRPVRESRLDETGRTSELEPLPSQGLLSFYDRLRRRIAEVVERRSGRLGTRASDLLLLGPDLFIFLARLSIAKDIPQRTRALAGGALLYFVTPFDLFPEAVFGAMGYLDDIVLAAAVLSHALARDLEGVAGKYWSGSRELQGVLRDVSAAAAVVLGSRLTKRLEKALWRRGVRVALDEDREVKDASGEARREVVG